jgi:5-methylthioadenosine/S-adenosylhomocysteine deaminase
MKPTERDVMSEENDSSKGIQRGARLLGLALAAIASFALSLPALSQKNPPSPTPRPTPAAVSKAPCDLVVVAGAILTMDPSFRILTESAIAISDGMILEISSPAEIEAHFTSKETILRKSSILMPGLVNTHGHAAMSLMRGISDDKPLMEWLKKSIFPAEAKNVSPEFVKAGTALACLEMIRGGTTTFTDMYYYESDVADTVNATGMRAVLGETWLDFPAPGHKDLEESKKVTREFLEKWKGHRRITAAVAPHAPFTCSQETLLAAKALADEFGAPLLIHLSETRDEQKQIMEKHGTSPTKWLDAMNFLGPNVLAAHGVWCDADDLKILAARKVSLSHNPESNMKLASGIAPIVAARAAGITVGLGTDGVAGSNNDLSMFEAMDFAGKLAKVSTMDPTVLPARELLKMATIEGAKALRLDRKIGSLEVGKMADLIAVDLIEPRTRPIYDIASTLVYAAKESDVSLTVVDGKVLWDRPKWRTMEALQVIKTSGEWREKITKSLREGEAGPKAEAPKAEAPK